MGSTVIANNLGKFQEQIGEIETILREIEQIYGSVYEEMEALGKMWNGSAHDALMNQFHADAEFTEEVVQILILFLKELQNAKDRYTKCENYVADIITQLTV